jgi:hypothetical protein
MLISDEGGSLGTLIVHTDSMAQTGKSIQGNAENLKNDLNEYMSKFESESASSSMPACLGNVLHAYATARTVELGKMVERRYTIGDLLAKAADLHALNEDMQKRGFANLYQNVSGFYGSSMDAADPTNIQRGISTSK